MKIFWWTDVEALASYDRGQVIAFASSKEEAIVLAVEAFKPDEHAGPSSPFTRAWLEKELKKAEPTVLDGPVVFLIEGSA